MSNTKRQQAGNRKGRPESHPWSHEKPRIESMIALGASCAELAAAYSVTTTTMSAVLGKLKLKTQQGQLLSDRRVRINRIMLKSES